MAASNSLSMTANPGVRRLDLPDADVVYLAQFLSPSDADRLLAAIDCTTDWRQEWFTLYGKQVPIPRLSAWHGDPGTTYSYSRIAMEPVPWTPPLLEIKQRIEVAAGVSFNSVLVNLYRDGRDSVAWHSDDEAELGERPVIGSLSLGATRKLRFRRAAGRESRQDLALEHGSLLIMGGDTQRNYEHQVPKTSRVVERRVNLTFRTVGYAG